MLQIDIDHDQHVADRQGLQNVQSDGRSMTSAWLAKVYQINLFSVVERD